MPEVTDVVSKARAVRSGAERWLSRNGWRAWVAVVALLFSVGAVIHALYSGYDLSAIAWIFGLYATFGAIAVSLHWFVKNTKVGKAAVKAGDAIGQFIVKAVVLLIIGAFIVWLLSLLFGAMPWWAALIILLLLFK